MLMKEAVVYADSREGALTESGDVILSGVSLHCALLLPHWHKCLFAEFVLILFVLGRGVCRARRCYQWDQTSPQREDNRVQIPR